MCFLFSYFAKKIIEEEQQVQWTSKAKEELKREQETFENTVRRYAPHVLNLINKDREKCGLPSKKRIDKTVLDKTIKYIIAVTKLGDAKRKTNIDFEDRGVYQ